MKEDELAKFLNNNFGVTNQSSEIDSQSEYLKRIQEVLAERIEFLISTDLDKLLQILYKIDVPQNESDQAFELGEIKKISYKLAERIIARQLLKIDYARKFYNK